MMNTATQLKEIKSELAAIRAQLSDKQPEEILTAKEVMQLLKISRSSYNRMKKEGTIKVYLLQGRLYSKRTEVLQAVENGLIN